MKKRGYAVRYPPFMNSTMARFYNHLLEEGHVDSKLLGKVFDSCPTMFDKVNFLGAVMMQPPTNQQQEWTEALGVAWVWTDNLFGSEYKIEVLRTGHHEPSTD